MTYEQLREAFLRYEESRQKLKLLYVELLSIANDIQSTIVPEEQLNQQYSLVTFDSTC